MTSIRLSFVYSLEDEFGKGKGQGKEWIAPPPGARFRSSITRQTTRVQSTGTKHWDTYAYGTFQGSWDMTFMLDYNYLEPLYFVFEESKKSGSGEKYTYTFKKNDGSRIPSFCVRLVQLNEMAGGKTGEDQIVYLKGCVCKTITLARSAGTSQFQVTMSGFYINESMEKGSLGSTDYQPYEGNLVEYSCLLTGGDSMANSGYIANTESLTVAIDNSADAVFQVCSPFASQYYEGITNYTFSATTYRNAPSNWEQRVYSGGLTNTELSPMCKGLRPMEKAYILSYDTDCRDGNHDPKTAYGNADKSFMIDITNCVIKSLERPNGDGSKLVDNVSSVDCQLMAFTFVSPVGNAGFDTNSAHAIPANKLATTS